MSQEVVIRSALIGDAVIANATDHQNRPKARAEVMDLFIQRVDTFTDERQCLVRITLSDHSFGWGATAPFDVDVTSTLLHRHLAPLLLGKHALEHEALIDRAWRSSYKYIGSHLSRALCGIDTALWDWRGRQAGKPVCELFGEALKPIPAYASSMRRDTSAPEELRRLRRAIDHDGYRAVKIKVGDRLGGSSRTAESAQRTGTLIESVGRQLAADRIRCFADANGCYDDSSDALDMGRRLADAGFSHFEEPCPYWDIETTACVTDARIIPVAGGEQDFCPQQWKRIIERFAVNIAQPDVGYAGGFTRALTVARAANAAGLRVIPHSSNFGPMLVFAAHLQSVLNQPDSLVETALDPPPWSLATYSTPPVVLDGRLHVSSEPGWGIEPTASWLDRAQHRVSTFSP